MTAARQRTPRPRSAALLVAALLALPESSWGIQVREFQNVGAVAHVIQLSVAPVFLLTAIGTMLSVMTSRLGRIIDRARVLEGKLENAPDHSVPHLHAYLATLSRRADLIGRAITLCTCTAVVVCSVIALLFIGDFLRYDMSLPVALMFILGMILFVAGLLSFLREIFIAKASLKIGPGTLRHGANGGA
ncbi:hypothetical protein GMST_36520 [Geomonas silvestris]|uniref:DUF2721 domain-containing protein n=1 Tax=Geomonas silvestris TaxID=2740184 RepID=A0A6V8MN85_9BACT|nr:DUF2721 domain-containing protein [Geomonas silvestris]GFO61327.1 hypothetical protein GMST_36520 [Geomonas silvestris]